MGDKWRVTSAGEIVNAFYHNYYFQHYYYPSFVT
jgi:hypothetical protein